jgi:hypothetical protein
MKIMLKTKRKAPNPIKVMNGTKLTNKAVSGTWSMTIRATMYSQKRKVYNHSVRNKAFFFRIN